MLRPTTMETLCNVEKNPMTQRNGLRHAHVEPKLPHRIWRTVLPQGKPLVEKTRHLGAKATRVTREKESTKPEGACIAGVVASANEASRSPTRVRRPLLHAPRTDESTLGRQEESVDLFGILVLLRSLVGLARLRVPLHCVHLYRLRRRVPIDGSSRWLLVTLHRDDVR